MSPTDLTYGLAGFATLHPLFTFGPALIAALALHAAFRGRHPKPEPRRVRVDRK